VTAHLSDATTRRRLWADRFDRWFKSFLDIQDEITKEVVSALQVELTDGEQARIWARGTEDTLAWENIVVATELVHAHHRDGIPRARRLAEAATKLDPEYAAAWAAVGWTYWVEGRWGWADSAKCFDTAARHVAHALSLDPDNPDALTLRGVCELHMKRFDEALATMEEAMLNAPGHAHIVALTGYVHRYAGDPNRVVSCMERAIRLSPVHPAWYESALGGGLRRLGRTAQAVDLLRDAIRRDPDFFPALAALASLLGESGEREEAKPVSEALNSADPSFSAHRWCDLLPFRDDAERERELIGLMKAGAGA
jgi:tetratricopeptide (TPR) repeat protein